MIAYASDYTPPYIVDCGNWGYPFRKKLGLLTVGHIHFKTFGRFSTTSRLIGEYLRNETSYRQSGKRIGNYKGYKL